MRRLLLGLDSLIAFAGIVVCIVLAPLAAIYWLVSGDPGKALLAVLVLVAGLVGARHMLRRRHSSQR